MNLFDSLGAADVLLNGEVKADLARQNRNRAPADMRKNRLAGMLTVVSETRVSDSARSVETMNLRWFNAASTCCGFCARSIPYLVVTGVSRKIAQLFSTLADPSAHRRQRAGKES